MLEQPRKLSEKLPESSKQSEYNSLSDFRETLAGEDKENIDAARRLVEAFLAQNDIRGLKKALENKDKSPLYLIKDKNIRKKAVELLSFEIKHQLQGRKVVQEAPLLENSTEVTEKDSKDMQDARQELDELLPEEKESQEKLLQEVDRRGRLVVNTVVSQKFGEKRAMRQSGGFQTIIDKKFENSSRQNSELLSAVMHRYSLKDINDALGVTDLSQELNKEKIDTAITIAAIEKEVPIYTEVEKNTGWIFKKKEMVKEQTGTKKEPIAMGKLNGNINDTEKAYKIVYYVTGTDENPYVDPDTGRSGGHFIGNIVLPESIAKKVFTQIEENQDFAKKVLEILDPELMQEQLYAKDAKAKENMVKIHGREGYMPEGKKFLIVPEDRAYDAIERDGNNKSVPRKINPAYIKTIK